MNSCFAATAFAAAALGFAVGAAAQQPQGAAGPTGANVSMCTGCHGIAGYKTAYPAVYHVPKIAGQQAEYIVKALRAYKSGERQHPSMRGIAASLSDEEMADLGAYYAGGGKFASTVLAPAALAVVAGAADVQPLRKADPATNVSMCIGCHGIAGYKTAYPVVYHVPKIAGQQAEYIVKALQAYKSGERQHPSMRGIAASLSDKDMTDLAAYYAGGGK
jgi:cytochrome c553